MRHLSVIIPAYNNLPKILRCLNSLQALAKHPVEYLVQDDASPEYDLRELIQGKLAAVERNEHNLGYTGNANAGAKRAHGDVLVFVNQDVYATPDYSQEWDAAIGSAFDGNVGIVAPRLLFPNGSIQSVGGGFDVAGQPFHYLLGGRNAFGGQAAERRSVPWATGAFLAVRRDVFEYAGGNDEAYAGGYFEDVDLCLRVRALGYDVCYEPGATLFHEVGSTGGSPRFMENAKLFYDRWVATRRVERETATPQVHFWA